MKARTKAQKRRTRAGRPKLHGEREPGGRLSRKQYVVARQARAVGVEARSRVYCLSEADSDKPEAGYALGRLHIARRITADELDAGNRMAEEFSRYYALVGIPMPSARAQDLFAVRGEPGPGNPEAAKVASNRVQAIEQVLGMADESGRPVTLITKRVCIQDDDTSTFHPHMLAFLKRGLQALVVHYRIGT